MSYATSRRRASPLTETLFIPGGDNWCEQPQKNLNLSSIFLISISLWRIKVKDQEFYKTTFTWSSVRQVLARVKTFQNNFPNPPPNGRHRLYRTHVVAFLSTTTRRTTPFQQRLLANKQSHVWYTWFQLPGDYFYLHAKENFRHWRLVTSRHTIQRIGLFFFPNNGRAIKSKSRTRTATSDRRRRKHRWRSIGLNSSKIP